MASFKYEHTNNVNTKAWIKDTAISKPTNAKKIAKGIKVITATIKLPVNNWYKYVDKIFNKVWPSAKGL